MVFVQIKLKTLYLDNYTTNFSPFYRLKKSNWLKKGMKFIMLDCGLLASSLSMDQGFFFLMDLLSLESCTRVN